MRTVRIHASAAEEAVESAAWYEQEQSGLGIDLEKALDAALDLLSEGLVPSTPYAGARRSSGRSTPDT